MKKIKSETLLLIVLGIMSFSLGIWLNYRQLWLKSIGFDVTSISKILSVSLICSSIIIFIISFFSTKIKLKNILTLSLFFRMISLLILIFVKNNYIVKVCMLLCIMSENIYGLTFYPLLSLINKSNETYKKYVHVTYFAKDTAVVFCGLMLGLTIGKYTFNYNTCLIIVFICTLISVLLMLLFKENKVIKKNPVKKFIESFRNIFKDNKINYYLAGQFVMQVAYSLVFGMFMIELTEYLNMDVNYASIFVILCSILGTIVSNFLSRVSDNFSLLTSYLIKYGTRIVFYIIAFIVNKQVVYIIVLLLAYITSKILDDKVNGTFIRSIEDDSRFLFGNIRYFVICIGEGIGIFLAGVLLDISLIYVFIGGCILSLIALSIYVLFTR